MEKDKKEMKLVELTFPVTAVKSYVEEMVKYYEEKNDKNNCAMAKDIRTLIDVALMFLSPEPIKK